MVTERRAITEMPVRVRYHECDAQGVVFNAHYLSYADMASFEVEKALFGSHREFLATGLDVVVAESNLRYRLPCRFEDELVVSAYLGHLGTTSLVFDYEIRRDGQLTTEIRTRYVFVDPATLRPTPPPGEVIARYTPFLAQPV
ncbi:acyl-CoA thioesterase [Amycolatopsis panacis]|uniref:Acyl-CoA thioesterase n=1 Tax=Amycolatopsis panacis TaxID=2340917 RepID=A0A419HQ72_9PSEU|nr:thioesterase family protein [Amycolatopsis panacis]RJQ78587.1 acyl-CoA thioesterase [Amycolatopsis panacis]